MTVREGCMADSVVDGSASRFLRAKEPNARIPDRQCGGPDMLFRRPVAAGWRSERAFSRAREGNLSSFPRIRLALPFPVREAGEHGQGHRAFFTRVNRRATAAPDGLPVRGTAARFSEAKAEAFSLPPNTRSPARPVRAVTGYAHGGNF